MNIRNKDIINCFPLLASILGNKYGVDIRIGGEKAMTDGNVIYIPALPVEPDNETLEAARGYVDHEAAHIRYTDFAAIQDANLSKLELWLCNAIEDWRVEKQLTEIFPGCGHNFRNLIKRIFGNAERAGDKNPALAVLDYVLLSVRSWAVPEVEMIKERVGAILDANFPGLHMELDALLAEVAKTCASTQAAIDHAITIGNCIRKYIKMKGQSSEEKASQGVASTEEMPESGGHTTVEGGKNTSDKAKGEPESTSLSGDSSLSTEGAPCQCGDPADPMDDLLSEAAELLPQNMGEALAEKLDRQANGDNATEGIIVATVGDKAISTFSQEEKHEAMRDTAALRQRLAGLLQASTLTQRGIGRRGKLDPTCLHRICVGNARVFRSDAESIALDAAVHILLDCSSSMIGESMAMARKACYAIVKALANIKGINMALTAFPAEYEENTVYPAIRHGQTVREMPNFEAYGTTPLGPALWWVIREMLPLHENRKIILILTDGVPSSIAATASALAQCHKLSIEVMGIGIQSPAINHLLPKSGKVIWELKELAPAMFELMRSALLAGGPK